MSTDVAANEAPLTADFRDRLKTALHTALKTETNTLITAPTSIGKTHEVATTDWHSLPKVIGTPFEAGTPLIHVSPSKEARDQALEMSQKAGVKAGVLVGREDACPVAGGDFDHIEVPGERKTLSDWFNLRCDVMGIPFSDAHHELDEILGGIPCCAHGPCEGVRQWKPILEGDADSFDVIHVTDKFIYNTALIEGRIVVFDEQPRYIHQIKETLTSDEQIGRVITQNVIRRSITGFLEAHAPVHAWANWEGLMSLVRHKSEQNINAIRQVVHATEVQPGWFIDDKLVHSSTPAIIEAILNAEEAENGYWRGSTTVSEDKQERKVTVVFDRKNDLKLIHEPPCLTEARCVIGFDAHPTESLWKLTIPDLQVDDLGLSSDELLEWRQTERGLRVYQVDEYTRQFTQGWAGDTPEQRDRTRRRARALIRKIGQEYPAEFRTAITSKAIREDVEQLMGEAGINDPTVLSYGMTRSRGDFEDERVGLLIGCNDPGDENILITLALLGLRAEPVIVENDDGEKVRETGRTFEGPDAEAAIAVLESVREMNVAQAIGRYARKPGIGNSSATVYVWTDAILPNLRDAIVPGVKHIPIGKERKIIQFASQANEWLSAREIRRALLEHSLLEELSKEHVRKTLNSLVDRGAATVRKGTGAYGADEYWVSSDVETDIVDLEPIAANSRSREGVSSC